jgi:peroxiredoxin
MPTYSDAKAALQIGAKAPDFSLPGVDGKTHTLASFADKKVLVVCISCNHCPYVQAAEDRMIAFQRDYGPKGVQLVAINPNDVAAYPEDSFAGMKDRAKARGFNFTYLRDEDQKVARAFGAQCTPEFFVFDKDRKLSYHGRIDDGYKEAAKAKKHDLREAADAALAGKPVSEPVTMAMGCSIKWKAEPAGLHQIR